MEIQNRDLSSRLKLDYMGLVATNLSTEFPTKRDKNQSPQLHRLARKLKFCF